MATRKRVAKSVHERFEEKIFPDPNSGCWLWCASTNKDTGYGQFNKIGRMKSTHRVSWELYRGEIPAGMHVLHKCNNRVCVNPGHLYLGSNAQNVADMIKAGRVARGERSGRSKLREVDVIEIFFSDGTEEEVSKKYGISAANVGHIRRGTSWSHITKSAPKGGS